MTASKSTEKPCLTLQFLRNNSTFYRIIFHVYSPDFIGNNVTISYENMLNHDKNKYIKYWYTFCTLCICHNCVKLSLTFTSLSDTCLSNGNEKVVCMLVDRTKGLQKNVPIWSL